MQDKQPQPGSMIGTALSYGTKQTIGRLPDAVFGYWYMRHLSADAYKDMVKKYHDQLGLGKSVSISAQAFDTYLTNQADVYNEFVKAPGAANQTIGALVAGNVTHRDNLRKILKIQPETMKAQQNFNAAMAKWDDLVKNVGYKYSGKDLLRGVNLIKVGYLDAMKAQQKHELQQLKDLKMDELGITSEGDFETLKNNLNAVLKKKHAEQSQTFEKSMNDSITALQKSEQAGREMSMFIAMLHAHGSKKMRTAIEELSQANQPANGEGTITAGTGPTGQLEYTIQGVNLNDLLDHTGNKLDTLSGRELKVGADGKMIIERSTLKSIIAMIDPRSASKDKSDFAFMAAMVKAQGHDKINIDCAYNDAKKAEKMARLAYAAALEAGFDESKISVTITSKEGSKRMGASELFKDSSTLQSIRSRAARYQAERNRIFEAASKASPSAFKQLEEVAGIDLIPEGLKPQ